MLGQPEKGLNAKAVCFLGMRRSIIAKLIFSKYLHFCKYEKFSQYFVLKGIFMEKGNVLASECPSREILRRLTSRWGLLVLVVLRGGTHRFSELRRAIDGVSERMLTQTLQQLEQDGMLVRQSFQTVPPHVEYTLTALGEAAAEKVDALVNWLQDNLDDIMRQQAA